MGLQNQSSKDVDESIVYRGRVIRPNPVPLHGAYEVGFSIEEHAAEGVLMMPYMTGEERLTRAEAVRRGIQLGRGLIDRGQ